MRKLAPTMAMLATISALLPEFGDARPTKRPTNKAPQNLSC